MYIHDISRDVLSTPVYEGDPETRVEFIKKIDGGDMYNLSAVSMCSHAGTHIDAPLHFCEMQRPWCWHAAVHGIAKSRTRLSD